MNIQRNKNKSLIKKVLNSPVINSSDKYKGINSKICSSDI